jgi:cell division protein FtsB
MNTAKEYKFNNYNYPNRESDRLSKLAKENKRQMKRRERVLNTLFTSTLYLVCFLAIFSLSYVLIERNSLIVKSKLESLHLDQEIQDKTLEIEKLKSDISQNLDLNLIEKKAMTELKMVYPDTFQTIYIKKQWEYTMDENTELMNSISKLNGGVKNEKQ